MVKREKIAEQSINMRARDAESQCTKFMQQFTFMLSRAPFVMNSFVREQDEGGQIINIQVRFSPETPQQRGGRKARKRRSEWRELARTGQGASSPETTIENDGIRRI